MERRDNIVLIDLKYNLVTMEWKIWWLSME